MAIPRGCPGFGSSRVDTLQACRQPCAGSHAVRLRASNFEYLSYSSVYQTMSLKTREGKKTHIQDKYFKTWGVFFISVEFLKD